ncbi:MAG: Acetylornithine deacetylase [Microgenomates group bacterium GW2011_GWA1_46_7]|nr:MAG: Acetylornithine deacetylase [Microgenomates group bacterium GW2011_GWA1_46_7]
MTNTLDLTKQLVSIPSWVGAGCNERQIGEFVYSWLKTNTRFRVIKQPVKDGRFNVIATDGSPTRLLLAGHMDTVEPRADWTTDPFTPTIKNDRLYGLGATDMKGSLSAMLMAASQAKNTQGLMILCYIDEEYDFAGMRAFVAEYQTKIRPEEVVSLDGYSGVIGTGCRGLIEVSFRLRGKSGHAGRPEMGVNAITNGMSCISKLKRQLATKYADPNLGITTLNLAYCQGGLDLGNATFGRQGNNIANLAEFVLDIRPASSLLNAAKLRSLLAQYAKSAKLSLENWAVRHDLGSWSTPSSAIQSKINLPLPFEPFSGYVDTQMIWTAFARPVCLALGASTRAVAHAANEYVEIADLEQLETTITTLIRRV